MLQTSSSLVIMFFNSKFCLFSCMICFLLLNIDEADLVSPTKPTETTAVPHLTNTITPTHPIVVNASLNSTGNGVETHNATTRPFPTHKKTNDTSEVEDMKHAHHYTGGTDVDELAPTKSPNHQGNSTKPSPKPSPIISNDENNVIFDVTSHHDLRTGKFNPTFAAIVASICIITAIGGYVMLMAWRKVEMDRYGNRQMLINEDDFGDIQDEDMRHFEMQDMRSVSITFPPQRKTLSSLDDD